MQHIYKGYVTQSDMEALWAIRNTLRLKMYSYKANQWTVPSLQALYCNYIGYTVFVKCVICYNLLRLQDNVSTLVTQYFG